MSFVTLLILHTEYKKLFAVVLPEYITSIKIPIKLLSASLIVSNSGDFNVGE